MTPAEIIPFGTWRDSVELLLQYVIKVFLVVLFQAASTTPERESQIGGRKDCGRGSFTVRPQLKNNQTRKLSVQLSIDR